MCTKVNKMQTSGTSRQNCKVCLKSFDVWEVIRVCCVCGSTICDVCANCSSDRVSRNEILNKKINPLWILSRWIQIFRWPFFKSREGANAVKGQILTLYWYVCYPWCDVQPPYLVHTKAVTGWTFDCPLRHYVCRMPFFTCFHSIMLCVQSYFKFGCGRGRTSKSASGFYWAINCVSSIVNELPWSKSVSYQFFSRINTESIRKWMALA